MKKIFPFLIFLLCLPLVSATWQNFGHFKYNNQHSYDGLIADVDNYSLVATISGVVAFGTQPLIYDLDFNGLNEILAVRNNVLNIYDSSGVFITGVSVPGIGNNWPSISAFTTPAMIFVVQDAGQPFLLGFQYNGSALNLVKNQTLPFQTAYDSHARCDASDGAYDCFIAGRNSSDANILSYVKCGPANASSSEFCHQYYGANIGEPVVFKSIGMPVSNTQGGTAQHYSAEYLSSGDYYLKEDGGDAVTTSGAVVPNNGSFQFIKRSSATDYAVLTASNEFIQVYDWTSSGKVFLFQSTQLFPVIAGYNASLLAVASNPLVTKADEVCGIFHPHYTGVPTPFTCPFILLCRDLSGVITANVTLSVVNDVSCLSGNMTRVTMADYDSDLKYEYFFGGNIAQDDFSAVFPRTAATLGWMIPADLRLQGKVDLVQTNAAGDLLVYHNGGSPSPGVCSDTDNVTYPTINYGVQGVVSFGGDSYVDYCAEGGSLTEFSCLNAITAQWESHSCDLACFDGGCISCLENWTCGDFGGCVNGSQTRGCVDSAFCGTEYYKPSLSNACNVGYSQLNVPGQLVDASNPLSVDADAFLPQLYSGIIIFFSFIIAPVMVLVVCVVLALLFWGIAGKVRG